MKTLKILAALAALAALPALSQGVSVDPAYVKQVKDWRTKAEEGLKRDNGWLTLAGRYPMKEGTNTFGTGKGNDIVFPPGLGPERMGTITVPPGSVVVKLADAVAMTTKDGQSVTVQYTGQLYPDGNVFDSSWTNGQPFSFQLGGGNVIKGWDQGLVGQRVGSRAILVIPSELGYGAQGQGTDIPKNADLIFAVDILAAN